jgi:hypothetical protein
VAITVAETAARERRACRAARVPSVCISAVIRSPR